MNDRHKGVNQDFDAGNSGREEVPQSAGALAGVRVLDFTRALAGPYCTQVLADHGAEVLKIETIDGGDITRWTGAFHPDDRERKFSGYFESVNRNKKSIALDLKTAGAREIVMRLIPSFDVVVENFRVGVMDRLGFSYETLREQNPRLVYATVRGFGDPRSSVSPYVDWPAYDVISQAMGGISGVTGPDEAHPTKIGPGIGDIVPALFLTVGVLAAVLHARESGRGQFVDVSMVDAVLALSERIVQQFYFGGEVPKPEGNRSPTLSPMGYFPVSDGFIGIAASHQEFFRELCSALDRPDLADDPRYSTIDARSANRHELTAELEGITAQFTKSEMMDRLGGRLPFGPVYDMADISKDEHFMARGMLAEVEYPEIGQTLRIAGVPTKLSETPGGVRRRAPGHGEHGDDFLRSSGFTEDELTEYKRQGVLK